MSSTPEVFDKGWVSNRPPSMLLPGELARAQETVYRSGSPGLWRAPGRTRFNSSPLAGTVNGLRQLEFAQQDPAQPVPRFLVAHVGSTYMSAPFSAETGTFTLLDMNAGSGTHLEVVPYGAIRYLLNGNTSQTSNRAAYIHPETGALTARQHGMAPVTNNVTLASEPGAGWPSGTEWGDGAYFFFVTEVDKSTPIEVESIYSPGATPPASITITGTAAGVRLTFPSLKANSAATHFRLYVIGPKENNEWTDLFFVDAQALGDYDISLAGTSVVLGSAAATESRRAAGAVESSSGWTNPNNILLNDANLATAQTAGVIRLKNYGFSGLGTIHGIRLYMQVKWLVPFTIYPKVELSRDAGATWSGVRYTVETGRTPHTVLMSAGGPNDLWGFSSWSSSDLNNTNFRVRITLPGTAGANIMDVNYAEVGVFTSATADLTKGDNYPLTVLQVGPITTVCGSNGPPPLASTGDIFEGCLVLNDVAANTLLRWSTENNPEGFPQPYYLNLPIQDAITCIRTLHNVLIVGTRNSLWRVNTLPRGEDTEFARGRALDNIDSNSGIVGPGAAARFTIPGQSELLAYISASGLRWTNGVTVDTLTDDMDWENVVEVSKLDRALLTNYPLLHTLVFSYVPKGDPSSTPTKSLWLSYHPTKIKEGGKLPATGPNSTPGTAVTLARSNGVPTLLTGHTDGGVYVEDRGLADASGGSPTVDVLTRDIALAGAGGEARLGPFYLLCGAADPGMLVTVTPFLRDIGTGHRSLGEGADYVDEPFRTNVGLPIPGGSPPGVAGTGVLLRVSPDFSAESFAMRITAKDVPGEPAGDLVLFYMGMASGLVNQSV